MHNEHRMAVCELIEKIYSSIEVDWVLRESKEANGTKNVCVCVCAEKSKRNTYKEWCARDGPEKRQISIGVKERL